MLLLITTMLPEKSQINLLINEKLLAESEVCLCHQVLQNLIFLFKGIFPNHYHASLSVPSKPTRCCSPKVANPQPLPPFPNQPRKEEANGLGCPTICSETCKQKGEEEWPPYHPSPGPGMRLSSSQSNLQQKKRFRDPLGAKKMREVKLLASHLKGNSGNGNRSSSFATTATGKRFGCS